MMGDCLVHSWPGVLNFSLIVLAVVTQESKLIRACPRCFCADDRELCELFDRDRKGVVPQEEVSPLPYIRAESRAAFVILKRTYCALCAGGHHHARYGRVPHGEAVGEGYAG